MPEELAADAPTWRISSPPQEDDDDITLFIRWWDNSRNLFAEMPRDPSEGEAWMLAYRRALVDWMTQPYENWHDIDKRKKRPIHHDATRKGLLTMEEAARYLSISVRALYTLVEDNEIVSIKVGGSRRIPTKALNEFIDRCIDEQSQH